MTPAGAHRGRVSSRFWTAAETWSPSAVGMVLWTAGLAAACWFAYSAGTAKGAGRHFAAGFLLVYAAVFAVACVAMGVLAAANVARDRKVNRSLGEELAETRQAHASAHLAALDLDRECRGLAARVAELEAECGDLARLALGVGDAG